MHTGLGLSLLRRWALTSRASAGYGKVVLSLERPVYQCCSLSSSGNVYTRRKCAIFAKSFFSQCVSRQEEPPLPAYVPRKGEMVEVKRARLLYQSRKRGMLENGLLLSTFAAAHLKGLSPAQLDLYDDIINRPSNDWELYYWMIGKEDAPADYDNEVMDMLKSHARNDQLEARYHQPDL